MNQKESQVFTMSTKRIILANGSRLLGEMFHRVISKADNLEVVQEVGNQDELFVALKQFMPEWVILSVPLPNATTNWLNACMANNPSVRFIFLSADSKRITMKSQSSPAEDITDLSLKDFLHILERNLQPT